MRGTGAEDEGKIGTIVLLMSERFFTNNSATDLKNPEGGRKKCQSP